MESENFSNNKLLIDKSNNRFIHKWYKEGKSCVIVVEKYSDYIVICAGSDYQDVVSLNISSDFTEIRKKIKENKIIKNGRFLMDFKCNSFSEAINICKGENETSLEYFVPIKYSY